MARRRAARRPAGLVSGAPWLFPLVAGGTLLAVAAVGVSHVIDLVAVLLEVVFLAYFARHFCFAASAARDAPADLGSPVGNTGFRPRTSVVVACRNEESVLRTLVASLLELDYPADRLQLVIVDDASTDRTPQILDELAARHPQLVALHRQRSQGGKSGALNDALAVATGEVIVVFDADHRPCADVVSRLVRHFADPAVGAVQGRCEIVNGGDSPLAQIIAIDYLAGYLVNEFGRQSVYGLPAYGGANCAVRASDLRALGGWNTATVTEDTDLTLRLMLAGRRVRYDVTAVDREEGVVTVPHFWRQRYRWARGHQQVWRDYRGAVWRSPRLSLREKLETTMFLLAFHLPVASFLGLVVLACWFLGLVHALADGGFVLWTVLFLGPLIEMGTGLLLAKAPPRQALALVWFLPVLLLSMALCTKAWFDGVLGRPYSWVKTARADDGAVAT